jgi:hypothetical protein
MQSTAGSRRRSRHTAQSAWPDSSISATLRQRSQGRTVSLSSKSVRPSSAAVSEPWLARKSAKRCAVFSPTPGRRARRSMTRLRRAGSIGLLLSELQILDARSEHLDRFRHAGMVFDFGERGAALLLAFLGV